MPNTAISLSSQQQPAPAPQGRKRKRAKAKAQESSDINYRRRRNIAHLVVERHGRLAKADLCIPYAAAAAWHCPAGGERRSLMVQWCQWTCAPPSVERQIDAILAANPPRRISADALARHLAVSDAERTALCIWSIGSYDVPWAARVQRRKEKKALAAKARRQARGAKPREQALSTTKPWLKDGIGERQWRRHRKKATSEIRTQYTSFQPGYEFSDITTEWAGLSAGSESSACRSKAGQPTNQVVFRADHHTRAVLAVEVRQRGALVRRGHLSLRLVAGLRAAYEVRLRQNEATLEGGHRVGERNKACSRADQS